MLTEVAQLIGREAQAIRESVSTAALTVRNDISGAVADDKAAHGRQQDRLETLETRVLTRLDAAAATLAAERPEGGLGEVAARLREQGQAQAGRLDAFEARLEERGEDASAALSVLAKCTDKLRNALDRFDVLSAAAASAATRQADDIQAAVRALESEVAGFGDRLAQSVGALDFPALRQDFEGLDTRLGEAMDGVKASAEAQGAKFDALRADLAGATPRFEDLSERLAGLDAKSLTAATRDIAAAQARCESLARQIAITAAALAALAEREGRDFDALRVAVAASTGQRTTTSAWDEAFA